MPRTHFGLFIRFNESLARLFDRWSTLSRVVRVRERARREGGCGLLWQCVLTVIGGLDIITKTSIIPTTGTHHPTNEVGLIATLTLTIPYYRAQWISRCCTQTQTSHVYYKLCYTAQ